MSFLEGIKNRISDAARDAEKAAADAANRAKEAVTNTIDAAKVTARAAISDPPAPSAASVEHAQAAAADAVRNATPPPNKKPESKKSEPAVFAGFGVSAAGGMNDTSAGGQASAGYALGIRGTAKEYSSTGMVDGAMGAAAGIGFEAGVVWDMPDLYGEGHQLTIACEAVSVSVLLGRDNEINGFSASVGKSVGYGGFHFGTNTEDK